MFRASLPSRVEKRVFAFVVGCACVGVATPRLSSEVRAAGLVARFVGVEVPVLRSEVRVSSVDLEGVPGKVYEPVDRPGAPALVLLHGVHRLGIEEPRLAHFAGVLAKSGFLVVTPEVREIAEYRIEAANVTPIARGLREAKARSGRAKVGVLGLSFAGGLAVMSAADPSTKNDVAFAVSVGGHADLSRVLTFFVTNEIEGPLGKETVPAHDYGLLVLAYGHAEELFPGDDGPVAKKAFHTWLAGDPPRAKEIAKGLSDRGAARFALFAAHDQVALRPVLLDLLARHGDEVRRVSPAARVSEVAAPVFLLHGRADDVIPAAEARSLAAALPPSRLADLLVSARLKHVELTGTPTARDAAELVHFLGGVVFAAENEPSVGTGG